MTQPSKPSFATNRPGESVAEALNGLLAHVKGWERAEAAIASAYFNPGGYGLLADELDHLDRVRLLLGAEPLLPERRVRSLADPTHPGRAQRKQMQRALEGHVRDLEQDRDLLGFDIDADASARRLVHWLRSGRVEVRRLEDKFLHGKAFVITTANEGVIAGSSNFTAAGLTSNIELNLGQYQPEVVEKVVGWFDELWDEATDFDLAGLYAARYEPHPPYLIYLRMLWERYGAELLEEADDSKAPRIHLTTFQRDGLWRAKRILRDHDGVVIADEVGLGKTFLAGELIRETVQEHRQRVLVVAPATLRDGPWRKFLSNHMLHVDRVSYEDLTADVRLNPEGKGHTLERDPDEYAMVVIDEAHNLRNPSTQRANALRTLLAGYPAKDLVLLSATPVNNSLWDLYWLLSYFIRNDAAFADAGIPSLRDHFSQAMAFDPDDLSPEHLFDVLDAIAVRRTRSFVKTYYPNDRVTIDGQSVTITFPTPRVIQVDYDLDEVLPGFFDRFARAIDASLTDGSDDPNVLSLARYAPSRFRTDDDVEAHEIQLAGLLRSGLLKRFESSSIAFSRTCEKMAASHDAFLALLDQGKVATGSLLADWIATDSDEDDEVDQFLDRHTDVLDDASDYDEPLLRAAVEADRDLLRAFAAEAATVTPDDDPKLDALIEQLATIAADAAKEGIGETDERDKRKVLVFSYFADTVEWITDHLTRAVDTDPRLAVYKGRVASLSGTFGSKHDVLWGFAPRTTDAPGDVEDRYDIVVATDVLAEGVNLQQARHIINYDLPWNPMRLVQRHGRIDRIGSTHKAVYLRCVFPDAQLDDLLGLEQRLHDKIAQAAAAFGVGEVLPGSKASDRTFAETREEIERLRQGDAGLFERGGTSKGVLSGEEYRQELRKAAENDDLLQRIKALPWGSGSGMAIQRPGGAPGYVFCVRVADHDRPVFRFVDLTNPDAPQITGDTLACLDHARPLDEMATPRHLDDTAYEGAYDAWRLALDDVVAAWNHASDPRNLTPAVPAAMLRAAELVRAAKPSSMTTEDADTLVDTLQGAYPERIVRTIRVALGAEGTDTERVEKIAQTVQELGLQPPPPPETLPEILPEDVHLICWLAIVPGDEPEAIHAQMGELDLGDKL